MYKTLFTLTIILSCITTWAQISISRIDTGMINGAAYKIIFPENWKGNLLMYAHGYEFMGSLPRQSNNPAFVVRMQPFLERGFAVAASDYSIQGFAIPEGVEDTEALRKYFIEKYKVPDSTFIAGHSMGGGVTLALIENFGDNYQGGLPLCPLSSRPYLQVRKEFDMQTTFNALFPDIAPSLAAIFDLSNAKPATPFSEMMAKVAAIKKGIIERDSLLGVAFAKQYYLKFDDLPFSLFFNENVLRDIAQKAQGNPFDNRNTVYTGFPDDWDINQKVERLPATVDPNVLLGRYDRSGNIDKPVVLMHTIYDQLIPPLYGVVNFENMVHQQNKDEWFTVYYTNGQGHCNFTPQQTGKAFDALRNWVKTGQKAEPGIIE
ncbi:MAG: alpha/beta hydrolase [Saprospiraceae bacterium]